MRKTKKIPAKTPPPAAKKTTAVAGRANAGLGFDFRFLSSSTAAKFAAADSRGRKRPAPTPSPIKIGRASSKRRVDDSHSEVLKEIDAFSTRISKGLKTKKAKKTTEVAGRANARLGFDFRFLSSSTAAKFTAADSRGRKRPAATPSPIKIGRASSKRQLDDSHSEVLKEIDAFSTRISKGLKTKKAKKTASSSTSKAPSSISDLRDFASSRLASLKSQLDDSHSKILKETEVYSSGISKRLKIQSQETLKLVGDAEKDYRKLTDRMRGNTETIKASFAEFSAEVQSTMSHVCKMAISELSGTVNKSVEALRNRYGIVSSAR